MYKKERVNKKVQEFRKIKEKVKILRNSKDCLKKCRLYESKKREKDSRKKYGFQEESKDYWKKYGKNMDSRKKVKTIRRNMDSRKK